MDGIYLVYFLLAAVIFFGSKAMGRGKWNDDYTSLQQTKVLQGIMALGVALHHMAQKTCAPWHNPRYVVHGLDPFIPVGYLCVGVFLFCSGMGLYKSFRTKPGYLKGFVRRRIVPMVIAFYLSEFIYTGVRALMGERLTLADTLWYLSGLKMANYNAWYVIVIPFFYLAFWLAFRFCRREGAAITWVFLFTAAYTVAGAVINHQNEWWMRGEWWYNSILLFPLGMVFARYEQGITKVLKKGYWLWLVVFLAGFILAFRWSERVANYYTPRMTDRILSAGSQWLVALLFVMFFLTLMMKVRLGNKVLAWFGAASLDFYLMHSMFVDMFGYNFADVANSAYYIKNVPLYIVVVLACSVAAALLFGAVRKRIVRPLVRGRQSAPAAAAPESAAAESGKAG